jgi:CYTH domain-containing protein
MEPEPGKYARIERERRFVVEHLPHVQPWADRQISDIYVHGTRLRLRRSVGIAGGATELVYKLTQKIPSANNTRGVQGLVTNVYLSRDEFEKLAVLPGLAIRKRRLSYPPVGVDVFEDHLNGLMIAEAEFDDDVTMQAFVPPVYCGHEVTGVAAFSGFSLARFNASPEQSARAELLAFAPHLATRTK